MTSEPWGWLPENVEYCADTKGASYLAATQAAHQVITEDETKQRKHFSLAQTLSLPPPNPVPPQYVLESSIDY
jgi:hypothetical protein